MAFKIYEETKKTPEVLLKLVAVSSGIKVVVVDGNGVQEMCGNLICFNNDGTIERVCSVGDRFGFKLDGEGRIEESK